MLKCCAMNVKDTITNDVHMNVKCNIAAQSAEFDNQKIEFMARNEYFSSSVEYGC
jgi:predicted oxidoreductase